jgi:hypothetical protein
VALAAETVTALYDYEAQAEGDLSFSNASTAQYKRGDYFRFIGERREERGVTKKS